MSLANYMFTSVVVIASLMSGCLPTEKGISSDMLSSIGASAPDGFKGVTMVETISSTKLKASWDESTDAETVGYAIYDATNLLVPKLITTVKAPASSITLNNLVPQQMYALRVRKINSKLKEDDNVIFRYGIPYGGAISADIINSTTVDINFSDMSDAQLATVYCKYGLGAVLFSSVAVVTDTTKTKARVTGLIGGETYTCRVGINVQGFEDNNTSVVTFIPLGVATQLVFLNQPSNSPAGIAWSSQPVVEIKDVNGNTVTAGPDSNAVITLTFSTTSPTGGSIVGQTAVTAFKGVATFSGLKINEAGSKLLTASKPDNSGQINGAGVLTADSTSFLISPGAVSAAETKIAISPSVPPNPAQIADGNASYSVTITLKDQYANPISGIRPSFVSNISGDTLIQPSTNSNALGVATGSIASIFSDEVAPFRTLSVSAPAGLGSVTTLAPFVAGTAAKVAYVIQPVNSPGGAGNLNSIQVAVQDVNGNIVRSGAAASSNITITISNNVGGALLSGTTTVQAVNGIAVFNDLGIDKTAIGYKLQASSGSFIPAFSNSFNITAGTPQKIVIAGASTVISGSCSAALTVQLQDNGGNPANAIQNTQVTFTGLGGASLYSSSACGGSALGTNLTFTAGTNIRTVYLKDPVGERLSLLVRDTGNALTSGTRTVDVTPSKISLTAYMPSPPSAANTPMSFVSGACSPAFTVFPAGENGAVAPLFSTATIAITGISASSAIVYSDSLCTNAVNASAVLLPVTYGGLYPIKLYMKDNKAETFSINVADVNAVMVTTTASQNITVLPSNIYFAGPSTVVAGRCSTVFTIKLRDAAANDVSPAADTVLSIVGLSTSIDGKFYTSPSCAGAPITTSLTIPAGASSMAVYLKDTTSEALNIRLTDPTGSMEQSQTLAVSISPASFKVSGPSMTSVGTGICAGPFTVNTMDGAATPNVTAAVSSITANLSTAGFTTGFELAAKFYSNNACTTAINQVTFAPGDSAKTFYYKGQYPFASVVLTAADPALVLTDGTMNWTITAAKGWLGPLGQLNDANGDLLWFRTGVKPVAGRVDFPSRVRSIKFDDAKQFLYVIDSDSHKVLKYDYTNQRYVGWIGMFVNPQNMARNISGSKQSLYPSLPSPAACIAVSSSQVTPGWCTGGMSSWQNNMSSSGAMRDPTALAIDANYVYVTQQNAHTVNRYDAASGAFKGWIGLVGSTPTGASTGGPGTCTTVTPGNVTPGWCVGGTSTINPSGTAAWGFGAGGLYTPMAVAVDATYLYVGTQGAVLRYKVSDGSYDGFIGKVYTTSPTSSGCTGLSDGAQTPGWCKGGTYRRTYSQAEINSGGIYEPKNITVRSNILYVMDNNYGGNISTYNATTGAFIKVLPSLARNWQGAFAMTYDNVTSRRYVADSQRVIAIDDDGLVLGWLGKIATNSSMTNSLGNMSSCSSLAIYANTPGWCLNGTSKAGLDEQAFVEAFSIESDGLGNILVGQGRGPGIKKFAAETGQYLGSLAYSSAAPNEWSADADVLSESYGMSDGDFWSPITSYSDGTHLYVADSGNGRIKKLNLANGSLVGMIGANTTVPTGGVSNNCLVANAMAPSPTWCTGALPNPWSVFRDFTGITNSNGIMHRPAGITGDGTYIYVTDNGLHRIYKFRSSDGVYMGWLGGINQSPSGGAAGCNGAAPGTFTPGWCLGGYPQAGSIDGTLNGPGGILHHSGILYVVDGYNHRVSRYAADSGAFMGWIGRVNTAPTGGCTPASNGAYSVSEDGWCIGGTSTASSNPGDRGGGFAFEGSVYGGITTDGTNLYISNYYNYRIDQYSLGGKWQKSVRLLVNNYVQTWTSNRTTLAGWNNGWTFLPMNLWGDGTNLYGTSNGGMGSNNLVYKMDIATGSVLGWQGAILTAPSDGETAACVGATGTTPGWCRGGNAVNGYRLGQYSDLRGVSGDAYFIYITDVTNSRIQRLPK